MSEKLFGILIVVFLIWLLIKVLRMGLNMFRGIFGMETLETAKAMDFGKEKIKDGTILFDDYQKYVDLVYKAARDKVQTMKRLEAEVKAGNIVPLKLPSDYLLPSGSSMETVVERIDKKLSEFSLEYICITNGKEMLKPDQEKYNNLVYMTLHAMTEINTIEQAKYLVDERMKKLLTKYQADKAANT